MAVAIEMNFKGATLDQYDKVIELMGLTPGNPPPPARNCSPEWRIFPAPGRISRHPIDCQNGAGVRASSIR